MKKLNNDEYECRVCKEIWTFCPEDYEDPWDYPDKCPLCSMPITQMLKEVTQQAGIWEALKHLWIRLTY